MARSKKTLRNQLEQNNTKQVKKRNRNSNKRKYEDEDDSSHETYVCGKCFKIMKASEQAMCCDVCEIWAHLACIQMHPDLYQTIKKHSANIKGLLWLCDQCKDKFDYFSQQMTIRVTSEESKPPISSDKYSNKILDSFDEQLEQGQLEIQKLKKLKSIRSTIKESEARSYNENQGNSLNIFSESDGNNSYHNEDKNTNVKDTSLGLDLATKISDVETDDNVEVEFCPDDYFSDDSSDNERLRKSLPPSFIIENKTFYCQLCKYSTKESYAANMHQMKKHNGKDIIQCQLCSYFTNKAELHRRHMRSHENEEIYDCFGCSYSSHNKLILENHALKKHKKKIMFCPRCTFSTWDVSSLKDHSIDFHDLDFIHCDHCSYFPTEEDEVELKKALMTHLLKEHQIIRFHCLECNYSTDDSIQLAEHRKIHSSDL